MPEHTPEPAPKPTADSTSESLTHRVCTLCEANCGIRVQTRDREVLRIEGDPTKSQFSAGSLDTWPRWVQAGLMYGVPVEVSAV
jgi:anaerobic selenocysteine-containing dehydrogenase